LASIPEPKATQSDEKAIQFSIYLFSFNWKLISNFATNWWKIEFLCSTWTTREIEKYRPSFPYWWLHNQKLDPNLWHRSSILQFPSNNFLHLF